MLSSDDGGFGRVGIASRLAGNTWPEFVASWSWLIRSGLREGDGMIGAANRMPAHTAANWIIERFLREPALAELDTLCLIDDDMVFRPDTLSALRDNPAAAPFDMVGALYATRSRRQPIIMLPFWERGPSPYDRAVYRFAWAWEPNSVVEVGACGFGFTLIRRGILEQIAAHPSWGRQPVEYGPHPGVSEDVTFCRKVVALGGRIAVDTAVVAGHLAAMAIEPADSSLPPGCVVCGAKLEPGLEEGLLCSKCLAGPCAKCGTEADSEPRSVWFPSGGDGPSMLCAWCQVLAEAAP